MQNLAIINLRSITKGRRLGPIQSEPNGNIQEQKKKESQVFRSYFIQHGMLGEGLLSFFF